MIYVYSPHNSSELSEVEDGYITLRTTVEQVHLHNLLVIAGDLNAKLGPDEVKFTFNKVTNRNEEYPKEVNLFSLNTSFMKPKGQLWIFEYRFGERAQIDYFRKKFETLDPIRPSALFRT